MSFVREHIVKRLDVLRGKRSKDWPLVRKQHLHKEPACAVCGRRKKLQVHHIEDFSEHQELELEFDNLLTLCAGSTKCHFMFGHLGNWRSINPFSLADAQWFAKRIQNRR